MTSRVHSVAFDSAYWTPTKARTWLRYHEFVPIKKMRMEGQWLRYRIVDPKEFSRFTTKVLERDHINLILGWP